MPTGPIQRSETIEKPHVDSSPFNILSLCAGVGGLDLGIGLAVRGARTICFVEREGHSVAALASRMDEGSLADAPVWTDLRTFDGSPWRGVVDCLAAGFPCQPFSRAGRREGERHEHWLWDDVIRVIRECDPALVFIENVDALLANGGRRVVCDLATVGGYDCAWDLFSARSVGASHTRPRLFILAAKRDGLDDALRRRHGPAEGEVRAGWSGLFPPNPNILRDDIGVRSRWPEPGLSGRDDGPPDRLDRLRAAGDAVVPDVARRAFLTLTDRLAWTTSYRSVAEW